MSDMMYLDGEKALFVPNLLKIGSDRENIYRVNKKKTGISGVLADFGNLFFQNVMAANIIENLKFLELFYFSKKVKKDVSIF